jgi:nuclear pore complex protein Nup155
MSYMGSDGLGFAKISKMTNIQGQILQMSSSSASQSLDERNFQIISINVVPVAESKVICLVAITQTGHRLYFSCTDRFGPISEPKPLRLVFVKAPPFLGRSIFTQGGKMHTAYYLNGLTVAAQSFTEEIDRIIGIDLNCGKVSTSKTLVEQGSFVDIEGKTWAISEAFSKAFEQALATTTPGRFLNEMVSQFDFSPRKFYLLTNTGLTCIVKQRPLDVLLHLITVGREQDILEFATRYGNDQVCAMSLAISCGHSSISQGPFGIASNIASIASKLYFELGGMPCVNSNQTFLGNTIGIPLIKNDLLYSAKHNGLVVYLARILEPLWKKPIFKKEIGDLVTVQTNLQSLDRFLKQYPKFTAQPTPDTRPANIDPELWKVCGSNRERTAIFCKFTRSNSAID